MDVARIPMTEVDLTHPVAPREDWHESVVLFAYDTSSDLSLYFRIGSWPHRRSVQEWIYIETGDGLRFRSLRADLPLNGDSRRPDGFSAGGMRWTVHADSISLTADYPDLQADLTYHDFYPGVQFKLIGRTATVLTEKVGHLESSGWVQGDVRIGGRHFRIDSALAHRDHSWGPRSDRFRVARWLVGTTGPALSHAFISTIDSRGTQVQGGWIVRNGIVEHADELDIVVLHNMDGITARGARGRVVLESGEVVEIDATIRSSFITGNATSHGGPGSYVCSEGVSTTLVNGIPGIACMTIANSSAGVGEEIKVVDPMFSTLEQGLSQRPSRSPLIRADELLRPTERSWPSAPPPAPTPPVE
jgi:hypothetical protein